MWSIGRAGEFARDDADTIRAPRDSHRLLAAHRRTLQRAGGWAGGAIEL